MTRYYKLLFIFIMPFLLVSFSGCDGASKPVFQKFDGLDDISRKGWTDILDITKTSENPYTGENVTVTVLESYYNDEAIWIGYKREGKEMMQGSGGWSVWLMHDGELIGDGAKQSYLLGSKDNSYIQYGVTRTSSRIDMSDYPDEFTLQFVFKNRFGTKRSIEFDIPVKRQEHEVVDWTKLPSVLD